MTDFEQQFDKVVDELEDVRNRGVDRLDEKVGKEGARVLPILTALSEDFATQRGFSGKRADKVAYLLAESLKEVYNAEVTKRVETMYGLRAGLKGKLPDDLMVIVKKQIDSTGVGPRTSQRRNENARKLLAKAIFATIGQTPSWGVDSGGYVPRMALTRNFREAVASDAKIIVLVGQPGMGKTRFAERETRALASGDVPILRMRGHELFVPDLTAALLGASVRELSVEELVSPRDGITHLMSGPHVAEYVILDNVNNAKELRYLIPNNIQSKVIATCRSRHGAQLENCRYVEVGRMAVAEAVQLIMALSQGISGGDAVRLAKTLHGHPLALEYACGLISHSNLSIDAFCEGFARTPLTVARDIQTGTDTSLLATIEYLVNELAANEPVAFELLTIIGFLDAMPIISKKYLARILSVGGEVDRSIEFAQGLRVLGDLQLVEFPSGLRYEDYITIHPVAQQIVAGLSERNLHHVAS